MIGDFTIARRQGTVSRLEVRVSGGQAFDEPSVILLSSIRYDRTDTHRLTHEEAEELAKHLLWLVKAQRKLLPKSKSAPSRGAPQE